jgi:CBS domain containing-hemolysin-like protein
MMRSVFGRGSWRVAAAVSVALLAPRVEASLFSGDALDSAANVISWVVLVLVPIIAITVFWLVHVLPEKIAHKRHHPQRDAIQTLCLLSLVFGGLLWPFAWLWAYTKPIGHKAAYGTDKHEDYFAESLRKAHEGKLSEAERDQIDSELAQMDARSALSPTLRKGWLEWRARRAAGHDVPPAEPNQPAANT